MDVHIVCCYDSSQTMFKLSTRNAITNFHDKYKAGINAYLTKDFRYRKSNYSPTRIRANEISDLKKNSKFE